MLILIKFINIFLYFFLFKTLIFVNIKLCISFHCVLRTVENFSMSSSDAPSEASPMSCENCAKLLSANIGTCPSNSWTQSLRVKKKNT